MVKRNFPELSNNPDSYMWVAYLQIQRIGSVRGGGVMIAVAVT